ncbi:MAG: HD domain-containing protein [Actinomycetota bacterium]
MLTARFDDALRYAADVHRAQVRKGSDIPYLAHLLSVAALVIEHGGDEDQAIGALLHDAAEDAGGAERIADIRHRYGDRVAEIVDACSDTLETPKPPWRIRKEAYLARLSEAADEVLLVSAADKLHNARSILSDYLEVGDDLWDRFTTGRDGQLWYYGEVTAILRRRLPGRLTDELADTVTRLGHEAGA